MNRVFLYGKVVSEPTKKGESAPCEFRLETIDEWKGERQDGQVNREYHSVAAWAKLGEKCMRDLKKGDLIIVEGFIKYNKVEKVLMDSLGKEVLVDGKAYLDKKVYTEIKAKSIKGISSKST